MKRRLWVDRLALGKQRVVSITTVKAFDPELVFVEVDAPNPQHSIHGAFGRDIIAFSIDDFEPPTENPEVKIIVKSVV